MAKSSKNDKSAEPLDLHYTLAELPSSQHRAGLAGLALMVEWLRKQPGKKKLGICELRDMDERGLTLQIDQQGLIRLFDEVYRASHEEQRSTSEWSGQEPLRIDEETIEVRGKKKNTVKTRKVYIYPVVVPRGALLVEWDQEADDAGNGPWIKLWRDMIWSIMRGVPAQRIPFNMRAGGATYDKDAHEAWAALTKPEASVDLPSTYFLGAQAKTAENVSFQDRGRFQFLLHFWPFVAQIYVPHTVDNEGKTSHQGYAIAVPDVANLTAFVEELPYALEGRDSEIRGFRPAGCLIDLSDEAALDFFGRLKRRLAAREGQRSTLDLVLGVDVFHMAKEGNNIRVLGAGRVDPDPATVDEYLRVRGQLWSPLFRRQRLANLIRRRSWYHDYDRLCATTAWQHTIGNKYFKHDAREAFKGASMSDTDTDTDVTASPTLEGVLYKMVGSYVSRKVKTKYQQDFESAKKAGKLDDYNEAREKVAREAFLAARSRTGGDFVAFFTSTICSTRQPMKATEYDLIARALLIPEQVEHVRTLTLLALAARS